MSKDAYYEMCDALSMDPVEEDIPLEYSDFPYLVQTCFLMYSKLRDVWDPMGGNYLGKDYSIIFKLFDLYYVEDQEERILALDILQTMDNARSRLISDKIKTKSPKTK